MAVAAKLLAALVSHGNAVGHANSLRLGNYKDVRREMAVRLSDLVANEALLCRVATALQESSCQKPKPTELRQAVEKYVSTYPMANFSARHSVANLARYWSKQLLMAHVRRCLTSPLKKAEAFGKVSPVVGEQAEKLLEAFRGVFVAVGGASRSSRHPPKRRKRTLRRQSSWPEIPDIQPMPGLCPKMEVEENSTEDEMGEVVDENCAENMDIGDEEPEEEEEQDMKEEPEEEEEQNVKEEPE